MPLLLEEQEKEAFMCTADNNVLPSLDPARSFKGAGGKDEQ